MGNIHEEIEIEGKLIKVKIDTGCDFPLALKKEVIEKLNLTKHPKKALLFTEEGTKKSDVYLANVKIGNCNFGVPQVVVEAFGEENLLGHPILQALGAKVDEDKEIVIFNMSKCPKGVKGGITGKIIE